MKHSIFQLSVDSERLKTMLRGALIGSIVTYDAIRLATGVNVQQRRGPLATALRHLERDGIQFETVPGTGLLRIDAARVVESASASVPRRLRAFGRRVERRMAYADEAQLSSSQKYTRVALGALGNMLRSLGKQSSVKALESAAAANPQLSIEETGRATLQALRGEK